MSRSEVTRRGASRSSGPKGASGSHSVKRRGGTASGWSRSPPHSSASPPRRRLEEMSGDPLVSVLAARGSAASSGQDPGEADLDPPNELVPALLGCPGRRTAATTAPAPAGPTLPASVHLDVHRVGPMSDRRCQLGPDSDRGPDGVCRNDDPEQPRSGVVLYEHESADRARQECTKGRSDGAHAA